MKDVELRLVAELLKNSRRSDRELAKAVGVSQPTITRLRDKLEKQGLIKEYTVIPDFRMLGFDLMALTFVTINPALDQAEAAAARVFGEQLVTYAPGNVIVLERGLGLSHTGVIVSVHRDYSDYRRFNEMLKGASETRSLALENIESFLIDLKDNVHYRSLMLSVLAGCIPKMKKGITDA